MPPKLGTSKVFFFLPPGGKTKRWLAEEESSSLFLLIVAVPWRRCLLGLTTRPLGRSLQEGPSPSRRPRRKRVPKTR